MNDDIANLKWIDLHLHTSCSDGTCTPAELVRIAADQGLTYISITDHDTINGLREGIREARQQRVYLVPGIEISAKYTEGALHILGYGFDAEYLPLVDQLKRIQEVRRDRNVKIIERLQSLGIQIALEEMMGEKSDLKSLGRPHIAAVLVKKGVVRTMDEAFDRYLGKQGKAFVKKEVMTSAETIRLIHDAGGVAVLAHPSTLRLEGPSFAAFIVRLVAEGLDGIEVYSSAHTVLQTQAYLDIAGQFQLLVSGGSDFHGANKQDVTIAVCNNGRPIHSRMVSETLLQLAVPLCDSDADRKSDSE